MFVKEIEWINEEYREAVIVVSDSVNEVRCFADQFKNQLFDELSETLECIDVKNIYLNCEKKTFIEELDSDFEYHIGGVLYSKEEGIICVGKLRFHIYADLIPGDIYDNDYIEFITMRVDI